MNILRKMRAPFHDDWCKNCTEPMEIITKQLYMLPMLVGHYTSHTDANYYIENLIKVEKKKNIETGYYACGLYLYRCPRCANKVVKLSIFLPVRDEEKYEETIIFENGELDSFLQKSIYNY